MNCPKCGNEVADGALFCTSCGHRLDNLSSDTSETNIDSNVGSEQNTQGAAEPAEIISVADSAETEGTEETESSAEIPCETPKFPADTYVSETAVKTAPDGAGVNPFFTIEPGNKTDDKKKAKSPNAMSAPVKPLSAWSYIWREMIFLIPVVNIVVLFIFAFAEGINKNSRSFARSRLIYALIAVLLIITAIILISVYYVQIIDWLVDTVNSLQIAG